MTVDGAAAGSPSEGDYYWGGAASTIFWVDPQRGPGRWSSSPSSCRPATFNFRGQLKSIIYGAIEE